MATILNKIVQSSTPPRNKTDLWLDGTTLRFFKENTWIPIGAQDVGVIVTMKKHDKLNSIVMLNYSKDQLLLFNQSNIPLFIKDLDGNLVQIYFGKTKLSDGKEYTTIEWSRHVDGDPARIIAYQVILLGEDNPDIWLIFKKEERELQKNLESGINIKTINGDTILGEGDLEVKAKVIVDSELNLKSDNPISNKAVTAEINEIKKSIKWNDVTIN